MSSVELQHVSKIYPPAVKAVDDLSLMIADGEFLVLLGPSGCGKSTTMNMIAGLEEISSGVLRIGQRVVNDVAPKDRDIAMVFQSYALYPHMTVRENLGFGLRMRKVARAQIDERVRAAAARLGLSDYLDRKPAALSGGQRQRVAVGRAIVRDPAVFLFDEPLSNLDAKMRVAMRAELKQLHQELRRTMIYVTHDQVEAMTLGDRIAVMKDGRLQQVGAPLEVYDRPANRFVAGFIGTPPTNFIPGRIEGGIFRAPGCELPLADVGARTDEVVLGLRPEDLPPAETAEAAGAPGQLRGRVRLVEPLGGEQLVHLTLEGSEVAVIARFDAHRPTTPGEALALRARPGRARLFAADAAGALLAADGAY